MNKWKLVSITLGIGILLFVFYSLNSDVEMEKYQKEKASVTRALSHYFQLNAKIMGTKIEDIECDLVRDKILLSNLVKEKPILIYRYVKNGCKPCLEKELALITERFRVADSTLIHIFGSYETRRDYLIANNNKVIKLPLYNIPENSLTMETEKYKLSYCFILHPNMKVSNIFIPDPENPEYTRQYLEAVKRFLND